MIDISYLNVCVLMDILMVEMDIAPSKTLATPKLPKLDSCNLYFGKSRLNFFKIILKIFSYSNPNHLIFRLIIKKAPKKRLGKTKVITS